MAVDDSLQRRRGRLRHVPGPGEALLLDEGCQGHAGRPCSRGRRRHGSAGRVGPGTTGRPARRQGMASRESKRRSADRHGPAGEVPDRLRLLDRWPTPVREFCRRNKHAAILAPSHGMGIGVRKKPMREYTSKSGDRIGLNWRAPAPTGRAVRHVVFDSNAWKSFVHQRFSVPAGSKGCLSLYGDDARRHALFADHQMAENAARRDRERSERLLSGPTNQIGRITISSTRLVGCHVAASMLGVVLEPMREMKREKRHLRLSDIQKAKRPGRPVSSPAQVRDVPAATQDPALPPQEPAKPIAPDQPRERLRLSDLQKRKEAR
jgi:hypothetical protein